MGFYSRYIFPRIMDMAIGRDDHSELRRKLLENVDGETLEIGFGTGLNASCYPEHVKKIAVVEPNTGMNAIAGRRAARAGIMLVSHALKGNEIPVDDATFDCVVSTWTLCSIEDVAKTLAETRRVLKPGGRFLFLEHGLSDDPTISAKQHKWNRVTRRFLGGCNVNRNMEEIVGQSGLKIGGLEKFRLDSAMTLMSSMYLGSAVKEGV